MDLQDKIETPLKRQAGKWHASAAAQAMLP
jgi:hypothetical protein